MNKKRGISKLMALVLVVALLSAIIVPTYAANEAVLEAKNGVVQIIKAYTLDNGNLLELSYGSGFLINDQAIMTCYHCVDYDENEQEFVEINTGKEFNPDRLAYRVVVSGDVTRTATIWPDAYSKQDDWAVLRLNDSINGRTVLKLGNSDGSETDRVFALGFPDSSTVQKFTADDVTVTNGVVSKLTDNGGVPTIEHDAQISAGSSGGPLVTEDGVVIGINYGGQSADGTNFTYLATQINSIKEVLNMLKVDYSEANGESAPVETPAEIVEPVQGNEIEAPAEEPVEAPVNEAPAIEPAEEIEPIAVPSFEPVEPVEVEEESGSSLPLVLGIVGAVILVVVIVVVVVVMSGNKKKAAKATPVARPQITPTPAAPVGAAPVAPFATAGQQARPYAASDSVGETSVLGGDGGAGETTVLGGGASASLTRTKNGETTRINRNEFVIGKERSKVDYCIGDNSSVSRRHAKIMTRGGKYYLVDLGSTNCTYINGAKTAPNTETVLVNGDKVKFSDEEFVFHC